jgi:hypothetical protein
VIETSGDAFDLTFVRNLTKVLVAAGDRNVGYGSQLAPAVNLGRIYWSLATCQTVLSLPFAVSFSRYFPAFDRRVNTPRQRLA